MSVCLQQGNNIHEEQMGSRWLCCPTFKTGEGSCFVPRRLVGEGKVGQAKAGTMVLVKITWDVCAIMQ